VDEAVGQRTCLPVSGEQPVPPGQQLLETQQLASQFLGRIRVVVQVDLHLAEPVAA